MDTASIVCITIDEKVSDIVGAIIFHTQYIFGWEDIFRFVLIGIIICIVSAIKPILKCKRLEPVEIIKGE